MSKAAPLINGPTGAEIENARSEDATDPRGGEVSSCQP
jgi:hypothetical protein